MKFRFFLLLALVCSLLIAASVNPSYSAGKKAPAKKLSAASLRAKIAKLLDSPELASSFCGIKVVSLQSGATVFERNPGKLFHPASNTKLITTSAALALIPHYRYSTKIGTDGSRHDSTLQGNLYIRGTGDPTFRVDHLDTLAESLSKRGIKTVSGDLIADPTYFDTVYWGSGWMWDDEPSSDEPFITPLAVNGNAVRITIEPGSRPGMKPLYRLYPPTTYLQVSNTATTGYDTVPDPLKVTRNRSENIIRITGRIAPSAPSKDFDISIWKPELFFLELFKDRLLAHGITVQGGAKLGAYHGVTLLGEVIHLIDSAIIYINKRSDNLGAESLVKTLGAELKSVPGSWQNGMPVIKRYLSSIGIDTTEIILNDGSGVSFYDVFTPAAMVRILIAQYHTKETFPLLYASLPIAGVDGTLRTRMHGTRAAGNVHAKTGTITGVSALSGYVTSADGKLLAFSIMNNHFPGEVRVLRDLQDEILELVAQTKVGNK